MGIKLPKINLFRNNPVSAVANAAGKVADAADGIVAGASKMAQATKRQANDMQSDSRLSKSVRPLISIWAITMFTAMVILHYCGYPIPDEYRATINLILGLSVGFYFPGRTLEKILKNKQSAKADSTN